MTRTEFRWLVPEHTTTEPAILQTRTVTEHAGFNMRPPHVSEWKTVRVVANTAEYNAARGKS